MHATQGEAKLDCYSVYDSASVEVTLVGLLCQIQMTNRLLLLVGSRYVVQHLPNVIQGNQTSTQRFDQGGLLLKNQHIIHV